MFYTIKHYTLQQGYLFYNMWTTAVVLAHKECLII